MTGQGKRFLGKQWLRPLIRRNRIPRRPAIKTLRSWRRSQTRCRKRSRKMSRTRLRTKIRNMAMTKSTS